MEHAAGDEEVSIESEFAATIHFIDLYLRQKTDLFLQHYVFEPFDFLAEKFVYLSLLVTLLAAGTLVVVAGVILLLTTVIVLWAALLITGAVLFVLGGIIAYMLFSKKIILQTPTAEEMMKRGNA
ncbi:MAG: phage holin family protein [Methanomicrobiales archaeon]|nr:phage holin family protein [Methanomicrobiales archaeon]